MAPDSDTAPLNHDELRQLLDVGRGLVSQRDFEAVLRDVLKTARDLTGARYAAIGVLDEAKEELARFLFVGIDEERRRMIGPLPRGQGVLGELIRRPEPLILHDVTEHPRSYGFPPGHPPMKTFLGVPIIAGGESFGNLYLTDKAGGADFDERDRELVTILADWASIAIDNARLYTRLQSRHAEMERALRGLEATATVARSVGFETDLERVLELIAKRGRALIEARALAVVLEREGQPQVVAAAGEVDHGVLGQRLEEDGTVATTVLASGGAERIADLSSRMGHGLEQLAPAGATAALVVPLGFRARARGLLIAFDRFTDDPGFDADDEHMLTSFAASAAIAIATAQSVESDRLRHSIDASELERRRWARELHDETLQELGALKVQVEAIRRTDRPEDVDISCERALDQIDLSIKGLQSLITELRPAALDEFGIGPALDALITRVAATSGLEIDANVDLSYEAGREPGRLIPELESAVYRLIQESLTNVSKHAGAERVEIELLEVDGALSVAVRDDGRGFDPQARSEGFGLVGMRERVSLAGGTLQIESTVDAGTTIRAQLPAEHANGRSGPELSQAG